MRPGSAELIEHYRTLADRGEPLVPDPDHLIPHRPGEAEAMQRINARTPPAMETTNNLDRAIDRLLSPEGEAEIAAKITALETERDRILEQIAKLRRLRNSLTRENKHQAKTNYFKAVDPEVERNILRYIARNGGGVKCKAIAESIGYSPQRIGMTISASEKLVRGAGGRIYLAETTP